MAPRRKRCPVCQSREWHKEPASGLITCSEGHVLQNYINENHETTEIGPHAMRKRTIKSQHQKEDAEERNAADPRIYHGLKGRYLYFQCLQLILRKQISALMKEWDLPPEFEIICRDLWTLHLLLLQNPPPPEPWVFLQEQEDKRIHDSSVSNTSAPAPNRRPQFRGHEDSSNDDKGRGVRGGNDSSDSDDDAAQRRTQRESADPVLAALLREASESSSSSSEDVTYSHRDNEGSSKSTKKRRPKNRYELPISNLAVLVLACWTMRLPIIYMDIIRLVEAYTLPYLEAIRFLPGDITVHLSKYTTRSLSPSFAPSTLALHTVTSRLARLSHARYGVFFPELNTAPVLWRAVRSLLGTPTLYSLTKSLSTNLSHPLTLHPSLSPQLKRREKSDPKRRYGDNIPPELSLIATVIIVIKMVYGLDDKASSLPLEPNDPAFTMPEASEYLQALQSHHDNSFRTSAELFSSRSSLTALDLDVQQIDAYLEFCEKALLIPVGAEKRDKNIESVAHIFPVNTTDQQPMTLQSAYNTAAAVEPTSVHPPKGPFHRPPLHPHPPPTPLPIAPATSYPTILKGKAKQTSDHPKTSARSRTPASHHKIYTSHDITGTYPAAYALILDIAARWVGVGREDVGTVIGKFEKRAALWWKAEKRRMRDMQRRDNCGGSRGDEGYEDGEWSDGMGEDGDGYLSD